MALRRVCALRCSAQITGELPAFVDLAKQIGARQISFLAVDIANPHAFGRSDDYATDLALRGEDLAVFEQMLDALEREHAEDFRSGFIAESPQKLRRIWQYFRRYPWAGALPFGALQRAGIFCRDRCHRPRAALFLHPRAARSKVFGVGAGGDSDLASTLNSDAMMGLRAAIRSGERAECKTCVCSMWREPDTFESAA